MMAALTNVEKYKRQMYGGECEPTLNMLNWESSSEISLQYMEVRIGV